MFGIVKHISDMNDDNYQGNDEIWLQFSVNIENISPRQNVLYLSNTILYFVLMVEAYIFVQLPHNNAFH